MRGILQDHYGVDLKTIEWWCQEEEDVPLEPAKWMKLKRVPEGKNVDQMLLDGELEAALYPEVLPSIETVPPKQRSFSVIRKGPRSILRGRAVFFAYAHRRDQEWVPWTRIPGLESASSRAFSGRRKRASSACALPAEFCGRLGAGSHARAKEIFGSDPWPYNVEDNRKSLEAAIRYEYEQGMIKRKPEVEELFFPASLATDPALRLRNESLRRCACGW